MSPGEVPQLSADLERQLERADSQLSLYARDLKRVFDSERRKSRDLAAAHDRIKVLDRLKTEFLAFVSREIQAPVEAVSLIERFDSRARPEEQAKLLASVRAGYERLHHFMENGLKYFTWLAAERVDSPERADLTEVVERAAALTPALSDPGVDLRILSPGPCPVRGKDVHLIEVVKILLENCVRFSPEEKFIRILVGTSGDRVHLIVAHSGSGVPPTIARELCEPFSIPEAGRHPGGIGLSLALASVIVEAHGGSIHVQKRGAGTAFIVELPAG